MTSKLAITGAPGVGKSTLAREVLDRLNCQAGGVLAREVRREGKRVGFELLDLATGDIGTLASIEGEGPRHGKYRVNLRDLEEIGARAVERAAREADIVVIDEVGPMELFSERFVTAVETALRSEKSMLVVVQAKSQHPLAKKIREEFRLITVTEKNRDDLAEEIASEFVSLM
ncbi:MAG TPA: NTPase [Methanotrichaceae archaeon]|nr:NTPase [Methanotrichaceae archaeon]